MPLVTFGLPACLATLLLVAHAGYTRGWRWAIEFFALGFAYFVVKENLSAQAYFHVYTYTQRPPLAIGDAPLGVVVGWLFASYLAWTLAERLVARHPRVRGRLFPTIAAAMIVTASISYPIEAVGTSLGWWRWTVDGVPWEEVAAGLASNPFIAIPPVPLFGWTIFVGGFLVLALGLERAVGRRWWLKVPLFAAGAALHFRAVHGIGVNEAALFVAEGVAFAGALLLAPAASPTFAGGRDHPALRFAPEAAFVVMALVVSGFALAAIDDARVLLCLLPLGFFVVASRPAGPRHALGVGVAVLLACGIASGSAPIVTLSFFPLAFLALLGLSRVVAVVRRDAPLAAELASPG